MADERLSETWMWERAQALLQQADRLHRQFFQLGPGGCWEPPVDIYETPRSLIVVVALPGVSPDAIRVWTEGSAILVTGERAQPEPCSTATVRRMEIPHGRFRRRIEVVGEGLVITRQEARDGCLVLELEKRG